MQGVWFATWHQNLVRTGLTPAGTPEAFCRSQFKDQCWVPGSALNAPSPDHLFAFVGSDTAGAAERIAVEVSSSVDIASSKLTADGGTTYWGLCWRVVGLPGGGTFCVWRVDPGMYRPSGPTGAFTDYDASGRQITP